MHKLLASLALPITEEEYREDGCLHYSTLAKYERGGFSAIPTLKDKVDTSSTQYGQLVDTLLTGAPGEFEEKFFVADFVKPKPAHCIVTKALFDRYHADYSAIDKIPNVDILAVAAETEFNKHWSDTTRLNAIRRECAEYYKLLQIAETKTIIDTETYQQGLAAVKALKESPATKWYFETDNPFDDSIERLYQGKFRATFDGLEYSCMADLIICNHKNKIIYPCDLKTSSHMEYEFFQSFVEFSYWIQAGEYAAILKANLEKDEYFKDFKIMPYRFIVVNKENLDPRVWEWKYTFSDTDITITYKSGYKKILRNFRTIGKELHSYLETGQKVPDGITNEPNDIKEWLEKS